MTTLITAAKETTTPGERFGSFKSNHLNLFWTQGALSVQQEIQELFKVF